MEISSPQFLTKQSAQPLTNPLTKPETQPQSLDKPFPSQIQPNCFLCNTQTADHAESEFLHFQISISRSGGYSPKNQISLAAICQKCYSTRDKSKRGFLKLEKSDLEDYEDYIEKEVNPDFIFPENEENYLIDEIPDLQTFLSKMKAARKKILFYRQHYKKTLMIIKTRNLISQRLKGKTPTKRNPWLCAQYGLIIYGLNYFVQRSTYKELKKFDRALNFKDEVRGLIEGGLVADFKEKEMGK